MAPNNPLTSWGNDKTMNLNTLILTNIQSSPYFKVQLFELKTFHEVVDEIYYKVDHLEPWEKGSRKTAGQTGMCGGVRGVGAGGIVSSAYCLLFKLFTLKLTKKQVNNLITHSDSPYIRGLGFMYIRYSQPPGDLWDWYESYLDDDEELDVKAGGGHMMTIGEMLRQWLVKLEWYSTLFPRIPVPIQKDLDVKLRSRPVAYGFSGYGQEEPVVGPATTREPEHIPDDQVSFGEAEKSAQTQRGQPGRGRGDHQDSHSHSNGNNNYYSRRSPPSRRRSPPRPSSHSRDDFSRDLERERDRQRREREKDSQDKHRDGERDKDRDRRRSRSKSRSRSRDRRGSKRSRSKDRQRDEKDHRRDRGDREREREKDRGDREREREKDRGEREREKDRGDREREKDRGDREREREKDRDEPKKEHKKHKKSHKHGKEKSRDKERDVSREREKDKDRYRDRRDEDRGDRHRERDRSRERDRR